MPSPKDELRLHSDHLKGNPRRVLGVSASKLIQCEKHAQFYPATESCPWCLSYMEEQEERARKATVKAVEPVKVEPLRTPGRRCFDKWQCEQSPWSLWLYENQAEWEEFARDRFAEMGPALFDATYP